jgi:hypothetical protein
MSNNVVILYKNNKNIFDQILNSNLVNPKALVEQNEKGQTVLHHLILNKDNKCAENVLNFVKNNLSNSEKQKFIDTQDENGNTAFHLATQGKNFEIATLLDIYGANKKIPNNNNEVIETTDSERFVDSSDEINCNNKNKINNLIKNIIKPTKNYNLTDTESNTLDSLDEIILTEVPHSTLLEKKSNKSESPKNGNFINNFFKNIFGSEKTEQKGGELDVTSSTSEFLKYIDNKINQNGGKNNSDSYSVSDLDNISISSFNYLQDGGAKKKKVKKSKKVKKYSASREVRKSDIIHEEVLKMIQDLGYSNEEAKVVKAGLYSYTKEKHSELSNYERALKMKSYTTQQHIANLDINAVKQAIESHYATKKK